MASRNALLTILCASLATAAAEAQTQPVETWLPVSRATQAVTGKVTFTPALITFQNGKSMALKRGGQMLFRPEKKARKVMADLYRIAQPEEVTLENGNTLCKGRPAAYLIVWRSEKAGNVAAPRTMAVFSGPKFDPGSTDDCGRHLYDAAGS